MTAPVPSAPPLTENSKQIPSVNPDYKAPTTIHLQGGSDSPQQPASTKSYFRFVLICEIVSVLFFQLVAKYCLKHSTIWGTVLTVSILAINSLRTNEIITLSTFVKLMECLAHILEAVSRSNTHINYNEHGNRDGSQPLAGSPEPVQLSHTVRHQTSAASLKLQQHNDAQPLAGSPEPVQLSHTVRHQTSAASLKLQQHNDAQPLAGSPEPVHTGLAGSPD